MNQRTKGRVLDNWVDRFLEWTVDRSEAPESLLLWSGLFCLSSVVKRKVVFPRELLGSYEIYPNLFIIFVGPAGVVRKSTTAGYAEILMRGLNDRVNNATSQSYITLGPSSGSDSKLVEVMSQIPDGAMSIIASEFSNLVKTTPESMYDFLTDIFDNKSAYHHSTRMHGDEVIYDPFLSLLGCTTPSWIAENPGYMIGGGFASRVIFVFEDKARQREMYYDHVNWKRKDDLEDALISDLYHISRLQGSFSHESKTVKELMRRWYIENADNDHDIQVASYYNRKHLHLHKICMLLSVAERDDLKITASHYERALDILEYIEKKMPRALASVGRNPYSASINSIQDFITLHGPVTRNDIIAKFYHDLQTEEVINILDTLVMLEKVTKTPKAGSAVYEAV